MVCGQNAPNCELLIKITYRKVLILAFSCISGDAFASIKHLTISVPPFLDAYISAVIPFCKSNKRLLYEKKIYHVLKIWNTSQLCFPFTLLGLVPNSRQGQLDMTENLMRRVRRDFILTTTQVSLKLTLLASK